MAADLSVALDFDVWFAELKRIAGGRYGFTAAGLANFDAEAWKEYFTEGYSPADALAENMSYT